MSFASSQTLGRAKTLRFIEDEYGCTQEPFCITYVNKDPYAKIKIYNNGETMFIVNDECTWTQFTKPENSTPLIE